MKPSKLLLIPMSTTFMFGCFEAPEVYVPPPEPTYAIEEVTWNITSATSLIAPTSAEYPEVYYFENDILKIYTYNETDDLYTYSQQAYTVYETTITYGDVDGTYEVVDGALSITYTKDSVEYTDDGTEVTNQAVLDSIAAAEEEDGSGVEIPDAVNEYQFSNGDFESDSGTAANDIYASSEDVNFSAAAGMGGVDATAITFDQFNAGSGAYGYLKYDSSEIVEGVTYGSDTLSTEESPSFSLEAVINANTAAAENMQIVQFAETSNNDKGFNFYIASDQTIRFKLYGAGGNTVEVTAATAFETDNWYHLAAVYDADDGDTGTIKIYVNGELDNSRDVSVDYGFNTEDDFYILGGANSKDRNFKGTVDNIATWSEALDALQVAQRASQFANGEEPVDPPVDPDVPAANYQWEFSTIDGDAAIGDYTLSMSKSSDNPREVVTGAFGTGSAVQITQAEGGNFGYHYIDDVDMSTSPLAAADGVISFEILFKSTDAAFNSDAGQDLQLIENVDSSRGYKLVIDQTTLLPRLRIYNGSSSTSVIGATPLQDDEWTHIVATYDGTTATVYVNGVQDATQEVTDFLPNESTSDKLYIGGGANSSQKNLEGAIDNVAFWLDTLTAEEVAARAEALGFTVN
ncbi:hypothetical protein F9L16_10475 [Agarivorans sp. B2Z047]|uniref:LamG domain-containing protein n=1 Tax=Agarivorans sp. B2Z047 TaxID=2652721 RepID=UPI00128DC818|nr:LamG domain-containing protein [Agarivorans sp. B2Z047]MPW29421.1 hypothetical protein [Agarivorans sp. B2Z047]UQN45011.1 LamG domain-containing protein [Agarivorans sp. B2Z047]